MKKIESGKDLTKLDGVVYELYQLNALIGFMQVAFAEGPSATDEEEAAAAPVSYTHLDVYKRQGLESITFHWTAVDRMEEIRA